MRRVALTGGLAAGKTTAARLFASHGLPVICFDEIAREAVLPGTPGLAAVVAAFGACFVRPDGTLDRPRLARHVFAHDGERRRLEAILHPLVLARAAEVERGLEDAGGATVIVENPLLVEAGDPGEGDVVIAVSAPADVRIARAVSRGMAPKDARARIAAQATDAARAAVAHIVLDGAGPESHLAAQVARVLPDLLLQPSEARK